MISGLWSINCRNLCHLQNKQKTIFFSCKQIHIKKKKKLKVKVSLNFYAVFRVASLEDHPVSRRVMSSEPPAAYKQTISRTAPGHAPLSRDMTSLPLRQFVMSRDLTSLPLQTETSCFIG